MIHEKTLIPLLSFNYVIDINESVVHTIGTWPYRKLSAVPHSSRCIENVVGRRDKHTIPGISFLINDLLSNRKEEGSDY